MANQSTQEKSSFYILHNTTQKHYLESLHETKNPSEYTLLHSQFN